MEAAIASKLESWQLQHLSLWSDYVEVPAEAPIVIGAEDVTAMQDVAQAARFREVKSKMAQDVLSMTAYNAKVKENTKRLHVVSVMHQKAQNNVGKGFLGLCFMIMFSFDMLVLLGLVSKIFLS